MPKQPRNEKFIPIIGYEGLYSVSILSNVKSETKPHKNQHGVTKAHIEECIMKPGMNGAGYLQVPLSNNGMKRMCQVHRLVAETFLDNPESLPEVNHINGNRLDNRLENLEWCNRRGNAAHASFMKEPGSFNVDYNQKRRRFRARITIPSGERKFLGWFKTHGEAAKAYDDYVIGHGLDKSPYSFPLNADSLSKAAGFQCKSLPFEV